ncbi:unnamed protein product [Ectocarpus sp. 12 AP-2014]
MVVFVWLHSAELWRNHYNPVKVDPQERTTLLWMLSSRGTSCTCLRRRVVQIHYATERKCCRMVYAITSKNESCRNYPEGSPRSGVLLLSCKFHLISRLAAA